MPEHNDDYYLCCLGVHVHTFTFIIALLVVLFWSACVAGAIFSGEYIALLICIPPLFSYGCLLIGNRAGLPGNYCPFLIVNLALIIGAFLFAGASYLTGAAFISHNFRIGSDTLETMLGSITVAVGTAAAIYAFFQFYYFYIVYRDYEYVKSQSAKKSSSKKAPRPSKQRRLYIDPKKISKFCPCSENKSTKKYSFKSNSSDEDEINELNNLNTKKTMKGKKKKSKDKFFVNVEEDSDDRQLNGVKWNKRRNSKVKMDGSEDEEIERMPKKKKSKSVYNSYTNMQEEDLVYPQDMYNQNYGMWRSESDLVQPWRPSIRNSGYSRWNSEQQLDFQEDPLWRITSV